MPDQMRDGFEALHAERIHPLSHLRIAASGTALRDLPLRLGEQMLEEIVRLRLQGLPGIEVAVRIGVCSS